MHARQKIGLALLAVACGVLIATPAAAQPYPTKPIRLIVPFAPGGLAEIVARTIVQPASQQLGQTIIVDNRPGADGAIAGGMVAKAAPDGYTLFFATSSAMSAVPTMRKNQPYDPWRDFTPITDLGRNLFFMYVHPSLPVRSLSELIDYLRAHPGKLNYGSISSTSMVATAQLLLLHKLDAVRIPYNGEAPAIPDIVSNRIQFAFMTAGPAYAQAREGRLRVLASLTPARSAFAPDVPTLEEAGVPGITTSSWAGLFGPARMPAAVVERLSSEFRKVMLRPEITETLARQGFLARGSTPAALEAMVKEQLETWRRIVREAGIAVD